MRQKIELAAAILVLAALVFISRTISKYVDSSQVKNEKMIIVLDAGHGGSDPGKIGVNDVEEKTVNLEIAGMVQKLLKKEKIEVVAKEIYGAEGVNYAGQAEKQLAELEKLGFGNMPVCMAKTQYSLSDDPALLGRPEKFKMNVREAYVSAGAGFVVVLTGAVMTMPGLPKQPAAFRIDVDDDGVITGLF